MKFYINPNNDIAIGIGEGYIINHKGKRMLRSDVWVEIIPDTVDLCELSVACLERLKKERVKSIETLDYWDVRQRLKDMKVGDEVEFRQHKAKKKSADCWFVLNKDEMGTTIGRRLFEAADIIYEGYDP